MIDLSALIENPLVREKLGASIVVVLIVFALRWVTVRLIRGATFDSDTQRLTWMGRVRFATLFSLVLGLVVVWSAQLSGVALGAVAFAAAVVIATKELILCVSGSAVRAAGSAFEIGDRIEVDGTRGDVIALGILTTTLLEVGPGHRRTGRSISIPNSVFVNHSVINETFHGQYVLHTFSVPMTPGVAWRSAEEELLAGAHETCAEFQEDARRAMQQVAAQHGLSAPTAEPRVLLQVPAAGEIVFQVRVPAPAHEKARIEQHVLRRYLTWEAAQALGSGPAA